MNKQDTNYIYKYLFRVNPLGMAIVSPDFNKWVKFNDRFCRMLGYEPEELQQVSWKDLIHPDDLRSDSGELKQLMSGEITGYNTTKRLLNRNGNELYTNYYVKGILNNNKEVKNVYIVLQNIAKNQQAEIELREAHTEIESLLSSLVTILIGVSRGDRITHWNKVAEEIFEIKASECLNKPITALNIDWDWELIYEGISDSITEDKTIRLNEVHFINSLKKDSYLDISINPIKEHDDTLRGFLLTGEDITKRKLLEMQLAQSQKLESVGQLAAGVAHEINTPTQYITDNAFFVKDSFASYNKLFKKCIDLVEHSKNGPVSGQIINDIQKIIEKEDLNYLEEEIPKAMNQSIEGLTHISKIVQSMKQFTHPGASKKTQININEALEDTITISRNEWKYVSDIVRDFTEDLPFVNCFLGEINQVFLNMIVNAAQAIEERNLKESRKKGMIKITTAKEDNWIVVKINDNGPGIPDSIKKNIYDPFFTTKDVGKGTGQGLALSYNIIVNKHNGELDFNTGINKGTEFIIKLPLNCKENSEED